MFNYSPHDLLQKMDREIIHEESKELGRRNRFWIHDDVVKVLKSNTANKLLCRYKFEEVSNYAVHVKDLNLQRQEVVLKVQTMIDEKTILKAIDLINSLRILNL